MSRVLLSLLAIGGGVVLGSWLRSRMAGKAARNGADSLVDVPALEIDDDTAADIIRRARPELERARELNETDG